MTTVDQRIKSVFVECQSGNHSNQTLIKTLTKIYETMNPKKFKVDFIYCLKKFMVVFKRETAVERGLDFVSKFSSSLKVIKGKQNLTNDGDMHPFLLDLFQFLLENHKARSKAVRFRVCQLINKLLADLGEEADIDDGLYQQIFNDMLTRVCDICPMVRTHAVLALKRLQDPDDDNCPIIKAYLVLMSQDKNYEVRKAVLGSIAICMKTLEPLLLRTRDKNHLVRKLAYKIISEKVNVKILTIAQRVTLIKRGLKDKNDQVRNVCIDIMLMTWFQYMDNDVYKLLSILFCQNYVDECTQLLLKAVFNKKTLQQLVENFNILDEKHCIPLEKLTCENVLYWQVFCHYVKSLGPGEEAYLDVILPTCLDFTKYLNELLKINKRESPKTNEEIFKQKKDEFILHQIVIIMSYLDTSDEAGRQALAEIIKTALIDSTISEKTTEQLVKQFINLYSDNDQLISKMSEIVSDILQLKYNEDGQAEVVVRPGLDAEKVKKIEIEMAQINVELMHLQDVLEDHIKQKNYMEAAQVKDTMTKLESDMSKLKDEMSMNGPTDQITANDSEDEDEDAECSVLSQAKQDPRKMKRCLMIVAEVLKYTKIKKLVPSLLTILDSLVLPGVTSVNSDVRNIGVKVLGLCCLRDVAKAQQYLPLLFQILAVDHKAVKLTAMKSIYDLLLFWGLPAILEETTNNSPKSDADNDCEVNENIQNVRDDQATSKMLDNLLKYLDSEVQELRTCCSEGFSRMLFTGRIVSSSLVSRLLLIWYNPLTEDDEQLRSRLASFFINYALKSRANQEVISESFLPTLKVLLNAPARSPLSQVKPINVAELLVNLSDSQYLQRVGPTGKMKNDEVLLDKTPHDDIAVSLCNEILSDPHHETKVKIFSRTLVMLNISSTNKDLLKSLRVLAKKILEVTKGKTVYYRDLLKFSKSVKSKLMNLEKLDADLSQLDETILFDGEKSQTINGEGDHLESEVQTGLTSHVSSCIDSEENIIEDSDPKMQESD